jgi:hypothetical protein
MRGNFDRKAYQLRLVDPQYDVAAMRADDIAGDGETQPVSSLFGGK